MAILNVIGFTLVIGLLTGTCQAQTLAEQIAAARNGGSTAGATPGATAAEAAAPDEVTDSGDPLASRAVTPTALGSNIAPSKVYDAPVAKYLSDTNASTFSITWLALEAANLADSINNPDLAVTMFIPTNAAWQKRLPTLTKPNDIQAHDLFSVGKSDALRGIMQYHILSTVLKSAKDIKGALSTSSNLCSNAKDLKAVQNQGSILLSSAGGTQGYILDKGVKLGNPETKKYSTLFPIDDVLLPDVVTIPLGVALQAYTARVSGLVEAVADEAEAISSLDGAAAAGAPEALVAAAAPTEDPFSQPASAGRRLSVAY